MSSPHFEENRFFLIMQNCKIAFEPSELLGLSPNTAPQGKQLQIAYISRSSVERLVC